MCEIGDLVRISGERGTFKVMGLDAPDGSILLYGGDKNPNGHRSFRSVLPSRIVHERRTQVLAGRRREDKGTQ